MSMLRKIIKIVQQMSHFKAKMHQIRFRLGLRPRPRWGSLQRSPRPPSWILGVLHVREGGEGGVRGGRGEGKEKGDKGRGKREGKGERKEGGGPQLSSYTSLQFGGF